MPSPRFWTKCRPSVNGARPIHCAPSPPICGMPTSWPRLPLARARPSCGSRCPTPTSSSARPASRCCAGSPSRSTACARGARGSRRALAAAAAPAAACSGRRRARSRRPSARATSSALPRRRARAAAAGRRVLLADDERRVAGAVERLLELPLDERRACPRRRAPRPRRRRRSRRARCSSGHGMPSRTSRMPERLELGSSRPRSSSARSTRLVNATPAATIAMRGRRARTRPG